MGAHGHGDSTNTYSVLINGDPQGHITPTRGIKQGDPFSPYLFLLCAKGLSFMLRKATEKSDLHGITSCQGGVQISHLLFAYDSLIFYEATPGECHRLLDILAKYEAASRQAINHQKTSFFFSRNTRPEVKEEIRGLMGTQIMNGCKKYLGLPMVGGKSKISTFKELQEKATKRVMGWKEKHISKVGREVLIKTVAQAIPTYSMSLFKILKLVYDGINSALSIGGAKLGMRRKYFGLIGEGNARRKGREEWGFRTYTPLT